MKRMYNAQAESDKFGRKRENVSSSFNSQFRQRADLRHFRTPTSIINSAKERIFVSAKGGELRQQFFAAFTIAELMVAMVVLIIMLGMTGMIYKSASEAVNYNNATTELYQTAEAIRRQLQSDFDSIADGSVLIISRNDVTTGLKEVGPDGKLRFDLSGATIRSDKVLLTATGNFISLVDTNAKSNLARILYGHANPVDDPNYGDSVGPNTIVNRWIFVRKPLLYITDPGYTPPSGINLEDVVVINDDTGETVSFAEDMKLFQISQYTYCNDALGASTAIRDGGDPDIFALNCGEVKIRMLVPANDDGDGVLESGELNANATPIWLNPPDYATAHYVFFRVGSDIMPKALEFTIRLYDRDLTVTSFDEELGREHAGQTFRFVIRLSE